MTKAFGDFLKLSVCGASHAPCISFSLGNFPRGFKPDFAALKAFMERRAPGRDRLSTSRSESDEIEFSSGIGPDGVCDGGTISGRILNRDARPSDYGTERTVPRPGHADFPQWVESGAIPTGGGANSGRLTAGLCAAGGLCLQFLERRGIRVSAAIESVHGRRDGFEDEISAAAKDGDSVGGVIVCTVEGMPAGLGGALFGGVETGLSGAVFAIPGVKGIEFGDGFASASRKGSENNDEFVVTDGEVKTATNRHGGILGGRTSSMPIVFRVAMKPTPTIFKPQRSVDLSAMAPAECSVKGRHDPCIVRRAVPAVEAMAAFACADLILGTEARIPRICLALTGATIGEDIAQYCSQRYFADMVELRVDLLATRDTAEIALFPAKIGVPAILTIRRKADGGAFAGSDDERARLFGEILARTEKPFAYVDFEDDFRCDDLVSLARKARTSIIRSLHDFTGPVEDLAGRMRQMRGETDEIPKIAFMPRSMDDVGMAFKQMENFDGFPHIVCAMGPAGTPTRILASRTHSLLTYASTGGLDGLGHLTPHELVKIYRFRCASASAELTGVTGWPLKATRSPELHNRAHAAAERDALMIPFPAKTAAEALRFMRTMRMRGLAVTMPHKCEIAGLLDDLSPAARKLGAVNTVLRTDDGRLIGFNTDADGFAEAIEKFAGAPLAGTRCAVLGAGGASKAVVFALERLGAEVQTFHRRTPGRGFGLIVNATPVDPIPDYEFDGGEMVYDLVYVPAKTALMARAEKAGCRTENGFSMLEAQARRQREIWQAWEGEEWKKYF
ncbi:MAG: chorismate synthase [Kiritimatiellae bacterium]|nr:chorismate synthase [Kiritimatiellia bacterium]